MLRLGLTGGIASGKSTVSRLLVELGVPVVDADALYHRLITPIAGAASPLTQRIAAAFPGVVGAGGTLDRPRLGRTVFGDAEARKVLEAIAHPAVAVAAEAAFVELAAQGHAWAVYDVPLLYERDMAARFAGVVVVWVPPAVQRARLAQRDKLVGEAATLRLQAQLSLDDKRARARWVIDNSGTPEATRTQVLALHAEIDALARA